MSGVNAGEDDFADESFYTRPPGVKDRVSSGGVVARVDPDRSGDILVALVGIRGMDGFVLPKGGVEGGETLEEAARREIEEEAGLSDLTLLTKLGVSSRLNYNRKRWITAHYFLFRTGQVEGRPTDPGYDYYLHWSPLDFLPRMVWPDQRRLIEDNRNRIVSVLNDAPSSEGRSAD